MTSLFLGASLPQSDDRRDIQFPLHTIRNSHLGEFQGVGLGKEVPGFAVGVVDVAFAAAFGVEGEGG